MSIPEAAAGTLREDALDSSGGKPGPVVQNPRRALAIVVGVVFIDLVGFGIVIPILPFYVRSLGVSDVFIGGLAASYALAQFVSAPVLGRLSDTRGRRPVLLLSLTAGGVAWLVFGLAGEMGTRFGVVVALLTLFASRLLAGAMGGNIATAQAYIADITPPTQRAGALGLIGAAFALGFVFGPALGGLLAATPVVAAADTLAPAAVPVTPFSLPSFAAAGLSFLAVATGAVLLEEPSRSRSAAERRTMVGQFRGALLSATLRPLTIAFFVVSVAFAGIQVMFIPLVDDLYGYTPTSAGLLLTYVGVLGAVNQGLIVGPLSQRVGSARLAPVGAGVLSVSLAALPFSPALGRTVAPALRALPARPVWLSGPLIVLLVVLAGLSFGNGLLNVSLTTLVSTSVGPDEQGAIFGVTQGAASLGRTVGPPLMAVLYVAAVQAPFLVGAVLLLPVVLLLRQTVTIPGQP